MDGERVGSVKSFKLLVLSSQFGVNPQLSILNSQLKI